MTFTKKSDRMLDVAVYKGQWVLQISDVHYDSVTCDRALLTKHLQEAEKRKAIVFINGDLFDLMQGKWDPRGGYSGLRQEYKHSDYLDRVIKDTAEYLTKFDVPYIIGLGNHETNIIRRMHTNPVSGLCILLREKGKTAVEVGYDGYIRWMVRNGSQNGAIHAIVQYFHHGSGGNAPRSKGVLTADIDQRDAPDAMLITKGHDHNKWMLPVPVERVSSNGVIRVSSTIHLRTGTYQQLPEYGWAKEKKFSHPPLGGFFTQMNITHCGDNKNRRSPIIHVESAD